MIKLENVSVDPLVLCSGGRGKTPGKPTASGLESNMAPTPRASSMLCGPSCARSNSPFNQAVLPGEPLSWTWLWAGLSFSVPTPALSLFQPLWNAHLHCGPRLSRFSPFSLTDASSMRHLAMSFLSSCALCWRPIQCRESQK